MRYLVMLVLMSLSVPMAAMADAQTKERKVASGAPDCSSSQIKYKKAADGYGNTILKQWACAAASQIPFEHRDSNPRVKDCMNKVELYKQVGANEKKGYCIRLDDEEEKEQAFLFVTLIDRVNTPTLQSTRPSRD